MKKDFVSSGRAVSDMKAHLLLVTKYRRKVINQEIPKRLGEIVDNLCTKWDCKLIEFNGEADHLHLLFQYYPQLELPKFITNLKSVSTGNLTNPSLRYFFVIFLYFFMKLIKFYNTEDAWTNPSS